ncbi:MAG: TlpA family protein disulfide reductase [Planctomycetes bacterium]|nr:TlpA family protein disulfide reductase [Planctomycetota bacterium]
MLRIALTALLTTLALAQQVPSQRTLADVQRAFGDQLRALHQGEFDGKKERDLLQRQVAELAAFVQHEAAGDDRWNARLMLADLRLGLGDRDGAAKALTELDPAAAPALVQASAAALAQHAGLTELRGKLIDGALARPAELPDRLAIGRLLMTVLREIERGEAIFTAALQAAKDDEAKAAIRWHRADALRDREDLPDNAAYEALAELAKDLPGTYYASVARDRLAASQLTIGKDAIPFAAKTTTGNDVSLAGYQGRVLVLLFWSVADPDNDVTLRTLAALKKDHGDALSVLGIALDPDVKTVAAAATAMGIEFPLVCDGKGIHTDMALRWHVEMPAVFVIGRDGKMAGLGLNAGTADGRRDVNDTITRAVQQKG